MSTLSAAVARVLSRAVKSGLEMHHVDQLDRRFAAKRLFVAGALETIRAAIEFRDRGRMPLVVAVAFDLTWGTEPIGINFRTIAGLRKQLWESPPELIVIHTARSDELSWIHGAREIDAALFGVPGTRVLLHEWCNEPTGEYPRHLWVISWPENERSLNWGPQAAPDDLPVNGARSE